MLKTFFMIFGRSRGGTDTVRRVEFESEVRIEGKPGGNPTTWKNTILRTYWVKRNKKYFGYAFRNIF